MSLSALAGGFIGASIGEAEYSAPGVVAGSLDLDSFSLDAGYSFNENFSFDVSYQDLGSVSDGVDNWIALLLPFRAIYLW